ncbi:MAG: hypothetical protein ACU85V_13385 [Gammaproteobacteria bacterium]
MRLPNAGLGAAFLLLALSATGATAADAALTRPDPSLGAREVVAIQLEALRLNDHPYVDAGIEQTWLLAHPQNRQSTGPLPRFAAMLRSPHWRDMLGHRSHSIEERVRSAERVMFEVVLETASGEALAYAWTVERVPDGEYAGCWMTTGVSLPRELGDVI